MFRFVQVDGQVYGPYAPEQLTAFLKPDMPVSRAAEGPWRQAADDAELAGVLSGEVAPALEWFVWKGGEERGPMTQVALTAMIRRGEIVPTDAIRHAEWAEYVPLGQTKLFANSVPRTPRIDRPEARIILNGDAPRFSLRRHLRERTRSDWFLMLAAVVVFFSIALWAWRQSEESRSIYWSTLFPPPAEQSNRAPSEQP